MSDASQRVTTSGGGGAFFLTGIFVVLKALGKIDWDWTWVFSPLWLPITVVLTVIAVAALLYFLVVGILALIHKILSARKRRLNRRSK